MKLFLTLALALSLQASAVLAHADLAAGAPAEGASVTAPSVLTLTFTESVALAFTGITLKAADGAEVATGAARLSDDGLTLTVPATDLAPGSYTVEWRALSDDGHKSHGSYSFTVK